MEVRSISDDALRRARNIRFILMDIDGTLTDGRIYCGPNGEVMKVFHAQDMGGIRLASDAGIGIGWVSGKASPIARGRAHALDIPCYFDAVKHKDEVVRHVAELFSMDMSEICFVGDDTNDIPAMEICGLAIAVSNAVSAVKDLAHYTTEFAGGNGAVREAIEIISKAKTSPLLGPSQ
ncbi:MAG: KdsC family phosphatase [Negativicutes bacterium]